MMMDLSNNYNPMDHLESKQCTIVSQFYKHEDKLIERYAMYPPRIDYKKGNHLFYNTYNDNKYITLLYPEHRDKMLDQPGFDDIIRTKIRSGQEYVNGIITNNRQVLSLIGEYGYILVDDGSKKFVETLANQHKNYNIILCKRWKTTTHKHAYIITFATSNMAVTLYKCWTTEFSEKIKISQPCRKKIIFKYDNLDELIRWIHDHVIRYQVKPQLPNFHAIIKKNVN